jgi:hypothetical protein
MVLLKRETNVLWPLGTHNKQESLAVYSVWHFGVVILETKQVSTGEMKNFLLHYCKKRENVFVSWKPNILNLIYDVEFSMQLSGEALA